MARVDVEVHGKDALSPEVEKASKSLYGMKQQVESSIKPLKDFASSVRDILAIGGIAVIARQVYQGLADMESIAVKLHPEMALASGSVANFNTAIENTKGKVGLVLAEALNPLRSFFIDLLDPTARATAALETFAKNFADIHKLYSSEASKKMDAYNDALGRQTELETALAVALKQKDVLRTARDQAMEKANAFGTGPYISTQQASMAAKYQADVETAKAFFLANMQILADAQFKLDELQAWLADPKNNPAAGGGSGSGSGGSGGSKGSANAFPALWDSVNNLTIQKITGLTQLEIPTSAIPQLASLIDFGPRQPESWAPNSVAGVNIGTTSAYDPFAGLLSSIMPLIQSFTSVQMLLDPFGTILQAMIATLAPVVNGVLGPLVGILTIVGQALGQMLTPAITALAPVVKFIGDAFIWLYNNVLINFANAFVTVGNMLYNIIVGIGNFVDWLFNGSRSQQAYRAYNEGWLTAIDTSALTAAGAAATGGGGGYSSQTTVQKPPDIYVTITVQGSIYGVEGSRQFAQYTIEAIEEYLGTGARVSFLEN